MGTSFLSTVEYLPREELDALTWVRLKEQVDFVFRSNRFYREKMEERGLSPKDIASLEDYRRLFPYCSKAEFVSDQEANPPFGHRLGVSPDRVAVILLTSGTSGQGQEVCGFTKADIEHAILQGSCVFTWSGFERGDSFVSFLSPGNTAATRILYLVAEKCGRVPYYLGHLPFGERIEWMQRFGVNMLFATPSYLNALSVAAAKIGGRPRELLPDLKSILIAGESYPLAWARRAEEEWGARIFETYGATQTNGTMSAHTCEEGAAPSRGRGMMHFFQWSIYHEILDPSTGQEVGPGEEGELVITTLNREASPAMRFRTGDRVRKVSWRECGCGRELDGIECGSVSRLDDMVKIRSQNVWPSAVEAVLFSTSWVDEYQARIYLSDAGKECAQLKIAPKPGLSPREAEVAALCAKVKKMTNVTFEVCLVRRDDLPYFEYKARRWLDTRAEQMGAA